MTAHRTSSLVDFSRLAQAVTEAQERLDLTSKQVAELANVDATKLSSLRAGRALSLDNLLLLCHWLGRPIEDFRVDDADEWATETLQDLGVLDPQETASYMRQTQQRARAKEAVGMDASLNEHLEPA